MNQLRTRGFVVLDHLVGSSDIIELKGKLDKKIEQEFDLKFPCLAIENWPKSRPWSDRQEFFNKLWWVENVGWPFRMTKFSHTIKWLIPLTININSPHAVREHILYLWLDLLLLAIVNCMGFYPHLTEAYIRRNFPCTYSVMNHNWHRDTNHETHLLKAFMFTDCDIDTGAHHYIAGSVNDEVFRINPIIQMMKSIRRGPLDWRPYG